MSANGLTAKQRAFVREYAVDKNATQAAIRAGYSPATAKVIGCENLTKPDIAQAIAEAEKQHAEDCGITVATITEMLIEDRKFAKDCESPSAMVAATLGLAKLHGLVVDKQQLNGTLGSYAAIPIPVAERDPIPAVDAAARPAGSSDQQASRH